MQNDNENDSKEAEDKDQTEVKTPPKSPKPHKTIWFNDGNIILATTEHLYRVHKSILSKHSSVFRDMFQLPEDVFKNGDAAEGDDGGEKSGEVGERWEGIPVVKMADDGDSELYRILSSLYDGNIYQPTRDVCMGALEGLFRMACKYDFRNIYDSLVAQLELDYPSTLGSYDIRRKQKFLSADEEEEELDNAFDLISLANDYEETQLLPTLFYGCASLDLAHIAEHEYTLDRDDYITMMRGRDAMQRFACQLVAEATISRLSSACHSAKCAASRLAAFEREMGPGGKIASLKWPLDVFPSDRILLRFSDADLCSACYERHIALVVNARERFWERLPSFFGLPAWEELTKRSESDEE